MRFGTIDEAGEVVVTDSLLQGGIVCPSLVEVFYSKPNKPLRSQYTISEPLSDVSLVAGLAIRSDVCVQLLSELLGQFLVLRCNAQPRTTSG
jgi:hypothetical protein